MTDRPHHRNIDQREVRLDAAWRAALQPESSPLGFASLVEARIRAQADHKPARIHLASAWMRIAAAAVLMFAIIIPLGLRLHHQAEVAKGEAARQQVLLALRITGTQLRTIERRTRFINPSPAEVDSQ